MVEKAKRIWEIVAVLCGVLTVVIINNILYGGIRYQLALLWASLTQAADVFSTASTISRGLSFWWLAAIGLGVWILIYAFWAQRRLYTIISAVMIGVCLGILVIDANSMIMMFTGNQGIQLSFTTPPLTINLPYTNVPWWMTIDYFSQWLASGEAPQWFLSYYYGAPPEVQDAIRTLFNYIFAVYVV